MKKMVIGILVSDDYEDMRTIKNTVYEAKSKLGDMLEICQITENYRHQDIKKFVQEMGITYTDVLRYDEPFNINSHDQNEYKFGKEFNGKFFHIRNSNYLSYCNGIFAFLTPSLQRKSAIFEILKKAKDKSMNLKLFK